MFKENSVLYHLDKILQRIYGTSYIPVILEAILGIIIGILSNSDIFSAYFIVVCIFYLLILVGDIHYDGKNKKEIDAVNQLYSESKAENIILKNELDIKKSILEKIASLHNMESDGLIKISGLLNNQQMCSVTLETLRNTYSVQHIAFKVCENIYDTIERYYGIEAYVTIYQAFEDNGNNICRMIAYRNKQNIEPLSYSEYEKFNRRTSSKKLSQVAFYNRIFSEGTLDPKVLINRQDVHDKFKIHENNREHEENICQYMAMPVALAKEGICLLMQVDVCKENAFGTTKEEVIESSEKIMRPYSHILSETYLLDHLIETVHCRIK